MSDCRGCNKPIVGRRSNARWCVVCWKEQERERCRVKPLRRYYADQDGNRKKLRDRRLTDVERARKYGRDYYANNRERILAGAKQYYLRHQAERIVKSREWRSKNPGAASRCGRERRVRLPWESAEHRRKRRALIVGAEHQGVRQEEWAAIVERFDRRCAYCFAFTKLTMDHVVPLCRKGRHAPDNVAPACRACNSSKHKKLLSEWLQTS